MKSILKTTLILLYLIGSIGFILISDDQLISKNHIWSDQEGYYLYLPAIFIYSGFDELPVRTKKVYDYIDENNQRRVYSKYTCGVALMQVPFFIVAHLWQKLFSPLEATGYSLTYSRLIWIAALAYVLCGLWILYRVLRKRWSAQISLLTIGLTFFGTNLLHYTCGEPGMSHAYSFFLFSTLLWATEYQAENPKRKWMIFWIITIMALLSLIRPVNSLVFLYPLARLWKIYLPNIFRNSIYIVNGILVAIVLVVIQLALWKSMTGEWRYYSYVNEPGFIYWKNPKLIQTLFSIENGWLVYTPLALLMIIGLFSGMNKYIKQFLPIGLILLFIWYISSSWWKWNFEMAFGYRPFVEYYALLSLPFAYVLHQIFSWKNAFAKSLICILLLILVFINIGITDRYSPPWEGAEWTWNEYLDVLEKAFTFR